MEKLEVTVLVATYNPNKDKLFHTLESIIEQKKVRFQIVITDDGSKEDYHLEVEEWFAEKKFQDFDFCKNSINAGTVKNVANGIKKCKGTYVKLISPGDMLYGDNQLRQWIDALEQSGADWSFSDSIYYSDIEGEIVPIKEYAHPQIVRKYNNRSKAYKKRHYLLYDDICLGAATLCKRDVLEKYLQLIVDKIIYAEDNVYRIMMMDDLKVYYYDNCTILYEYGQGVSTNKSDIWAERLKKDWDAADLIMGRKNLKYINKSKNMKNKIVRKLLRIKSKFVKRTTSMDLNTDYIKRMKYNI